MNFHVERNNTRTCLRRYTLNLTLFEIDRAVTTVFSSIFFFTVVYSSENRIGQEQRCRSNVSTVDNQHVHTFLETIIIFTFINYIVHYYNLFSFYAWAQWKLVRRKRSTGAETIKKDIEEIRVRRTKKTRLDVIANLFFFSNGFIFTRYSTSASWSQFR